MKSKQLRILVTAALALTTAALSRPAPGQTYRGDDTCAYGTPGCNVCVPNVSEAFSRASGSRNARHTFRFRQKTPSLNLDVPPKLKIKQHIQGISRIPGLDHENWVALSHSALELGDGALYLVRFDFIHSDGDAWKWAPRRLRDDTRSYFYHRIPGTNHSGGLQALGTMLFTANECGAGQKCSAFITVHDIHDPSAPKLLSRLELDGSQGELSQFDSSAAGVAAARLADGRTILFFRGREREENGWFFVSDTPFIAESTKWQFIRTWHRSEMPAGSPWHPWENLNFLTECGTGDLYLIGLGTMKDRVSLYRLTEGPGLEFVSGRRLRTSGLLTTPRAGGGVHITPDGNLVTYITDRRPPLVKIDEFRYRK